MWPILGTGLFHSLRSGSASCSLKPGVLNAGTFASLHLFYLTIGSIYLPSSGDFNKSLVFWWLSSLFDAVRSLLSSVSLYCNFYRNFGGRKVNIYVSSLSNRTRCFSIIYVRCRALNWMEIATSIYFHLYIYITTPCYWMCRLFKIFLKMLSIILMFLILKSPFSLDTRRNYHKQNTNLTWINVSSISVKYSILF